MANDTASSGASGVLSSVEVGIVTARPDLADFYGDVFGLGRLESVRASSGTVHRLQLPGGVLKIMVPSEPPAEPARTGSFLALSGFRYLTMRVSDLDPVVKVAEARGGRIVHGPMDLPDGSRLVVLEDPDGNALEVAQPPA